MDIFLVALPASGIVALACWRILVGAIAARPIGDRLRIAAALERAHSGPSVTAADFPVLERLFAAAGTLRGPSGGTALIRAYYSAASAVRRATPILAPLAEREMTICSRYLAVRIDALLAGNAACSRRLRSL